jgi:hypothetical protein
LISQTMYQGLCPLQRGGSLSVSTEVQLQTWNKWRLNFIRGISESGDPVLLLKLNLRSSSIHHWFLFGYVFVSLVYPSCTISLVNLYIFMLFFILSAPLLPCWLWCRGWKVAAVHCGIMKTKWELFQKWV